jgi:uncharacterized protein YrrD
MQIGRGGGTVNIETGAHVIGTDGKLGEVSDVIAEASSDRIIEIVVKHGLPFAHSYTVVPLGLIERVEDGNVYIKLDKVSLSMGTEFVANLHANETDYVGPPSQDHEGTYRGNMDFDAMTLSGGQMPAKPGGYPGGEVLSPDDMEEVKIGPGSPVFSADGMKVGEVGELGFDQETGESTYLSIRTGHLLRHTTEIPSAWVRDLSTHGVILKVTADAVDTLTKHTHHEAS